MFHLTALTSERIHDLHATASELRAEQIAGATQNPLRTLRLFVGTALVAAGTTLVKSAKPVATSRAAR
ncbi:MAG: hypothetical protein HYX54_08375 [Chloroflexi bacterium]|nr:hypothetical protein [Chloroflexota bacterium]